MSSITQIIPVEIMHFSILPYLEVKDLGRCCQVSHELRQIASQDDLWAKWFPGCIEGRIGQGSNIKQYVYAAFTSKNLSKSLEDLLDVIEKIYRRMGPDQNFEIIVDPIFYPEKCEMRIIMAEPTQTYILRTMTGGPVITQWCPFIGKISKENQGRVINGGISQGLIRDSSGEVRKIVGVFQIGFDLELRCSVERIVFERLRQIALRCPQKRVEYV